MNPDPQKINADPQPWPEGCGTDAERAVKRIRSEVVEMVGRYVMGRLSRNRKGKGVMPSGMLCDQQEWLV